jgi:heterodisulfide reductase subunit C
VTTGIEWKAPTFLREVERRSGTEVSACYQCHKCVSGCPVAPDADFKSSQVMRLIHLGAEDAVLGSDAIWLCASCEACTTRCPMDIDIAAVMDTLRMLAVERGAKLATSRDKKFGRAFLGSVRRHGRVFELEMLMAYKLRTLDLFGDLDKAPLMYSKRKLRLFPKRSRSVRQVREIFRRAKKEEQQR